MTGIEIAAKVLLGAASKPILDRLKRQEHVVALLKKLKLAPNVPPRDFDGVYVYTLIEYCYGKPEPVVNLFRNEYIRQAFQRSFESGDPSYLDREAEEVIRWNDETGGLGDVPDYNLRREFAGFSVMFNAVVDRTRGAAESRSDLRREEISLDLQERLETLRGLVSQQSTSLEDIRKIVMTPAAGQLDPIGWLAAEAKQWFDALGYPFESYSAPTQEAFTWIINVPARRGRYDRIVVYGTDGEAETKDVSHVLSLVSNYRADEGWVLVPRRVSAAAREATTRQNGVVACYTLDELIDQDADFEPYLAWLESEVRRRKIDSNYVSIHCNKDEYDPTSGQVVARSFYGRDENGLIGYAKSWLSDPSKEHLSVLGEFGTGKSWYCLRLAWELAKDYQEAKRSGLPRPRLPILTPLRDYAKAVSVESLFSEFFFRRHKVQLTNYSVFEYLNRAGRLVLIFDGFDEMASRVDRQARINNFWELAKVVVPGAKVLLTCRTEHFPEAKESRELLGAQLRASTQALSGEPPQFEVVEVAPFDDTQVKQLLSNITDQETVDLVMSDSQLLDLMRRPVMSELLIDALPDIVIGKKIDISRVYMYAVKRKMSRDIHAARTFTSMQDKLFFLCELSWEMLATDTMSMNYRQFPDRIRDYFGSAVKEDKDLDHWHHDMMAQSMLIRNHEGDYTPAHRSLLEFFVAYKLVAELGLLAPDFLELMQEEESSNGTSARWSEHFHRASPSDRLAPISEFSTEPTERLAETFGSAVLVGAVMKMMIPMVDRVRATYTFGRIIQDTRHRSADSIRFVGGNAASLLARIDPTELREIDLNGTNLSGAMLDIRDGERVDLSNCDMRGSYLRDTDLEAVQLVNADLTGADLNESIYFGYCSGYPIWSSCHNADGPVFIATDAKEILRWYPESGNRPETILAAPDDLYAIDLTKDGRILVIDTFDEGCLVCNAVDPGVEYRIADATQIMLIEQEGFQGILAMERESDNLSVRDLQSGDEVNRLGTSTWPVGYSESQQRVIVVRTRLDKIEIVGMDVLGPHNNEIIYGEIEGDVSKSRVRVHFAADLMWRWKMNSNRVMVHRMDGSPYGSFEYGTVDRSSIDMSAQWLAVDRGSDMFVVSNGDGVRAYQLSTLSEIWNTAANLPVITVGLAGSGVALDANRYGEIVLRSIGNGIALARTSVNSEIAGARISRGHGISEEVLASLAVGGAIISD